MAILGEIKSIIGGRAKDRMKIAKKIAPSRNPAEGAFFIYNSIILHDFIE